MCACEEISYYYHHIIIVIIGALHVCVMYIMCIAYCILCKTGVTVIGH